MMAKNIVSHVCSVLIHCARTFVLPVNALDGCMLGQLASALQ